MLNRCNTESSGECFVFQRSNIGTNSKYKWLAREGLYPEAGEFHGPSMISSASAKKMLKSCYGGRAGTFAHFTDKITHLPEAAVGN